jgi:hypothetical protein
MYSIGQILFFVLSKKSQVYPMQVVEIITKKNLSGEEATYVLQAGPEKETKLTLDQVDGEVFESPDVLRQTLVHRASVQVNKLIDNAVDKSNTWYSSGKSSSQVPQTIQNLPALLAKPDTSRVQEDAEDEGSFVTMPDGSVIRVRLPSSIM